MLSRALFSVTLIRLWRLLPKAIQLTKNADNICEWTSFSQRYISARLEKATATIQAYFECRGLTISVEKHGAVASTRRKVEQYPILLKGKVIPLKRQRIFHGITRDLTFRWGPHITRLKKKLLTVISIIPLDSETRWGSSVFSTKQL